MVSPSRDQRNVDQLFSVLCHKQGDVEGRVPHRSNVCGQSQSSGVIILIIMMMVVMMMIEHVILC